MVVEKIDLTGDNVCNDVIGWFSEYYYFRFQSLSIVNNMT